MEVFENSVETASHTVYLGDEIVAPVGEVKAVIQEADGSNEQILTASGDNGHYTVDLGLAVTGNNRPKTIFWRYTLNVNGTNEQIETIPEPIYTVRPYVSVNEYNRGSHPGDALLVSDFRRLEQVARFVIEAYTRQSFQIRRGVEHVITGGSSNSLQLPDRLVRLEDVRVQGENDYSILNYVHYNPYNPWEISKSTDATWDGEMSPLSRNEFFKYPKNYVVRGDWGWLNVPEAVKNATAILIRDYQDDDALYREKYITVIRAADWRMEFGATGMETTGNANADMMLEKYRNYRLEVV